MYACMYVRRQAHACIDVFWSCFPGLLDSDVRLRAGGVNKEAPTEDIYIYIHTCVYVYIYMYIENIFMYIHT